MTGFVDRAVDRIAWVAERVVIVTFGVMVIAVLASVFTRNISVPVTWLEEMSRYMQIWFVSVGFALALRKGMLAGTEVLLKLLPDRMTKAVVILVKLGMLAISVLMLVAATPLIEHLIRTGQESPNLRIPIVLVYLGIYSGFALAVVFILSSLLTNLRGRRDDLDKTFLAVADEDELAAAAERAKGGVL